MGMSASLTNAKKKDISAFISKIVKEKNKEVIHQFEMKITSFFLMLDNLPSLFLHSFVFH